MDNPGFSNEDNRWVEDRIASLSTPPGWKPNAERAFERVQQESKTAASARGLRILMAAATLGVIALVVSALPWSALWKSNSKNTPDPAAQQFVGPVAVTAEPSKEEPSPAPTPVQNVAPETTLTAKATEGTLPLATHIEPLPETTAVQPSTGPAQAQNPQPAPPSNVTEPTLLSQVQPAYTPEAREARVQGTVEIQLTVREDGTVKAEKVVRGLGYGLDEAAIAAVEQWKFRPGTKDGKPVAVMLSVLINFSLR